MTPELRAKVIEALARGSDDWRMPLELRQRAERQLRNLTALQR